MFEFATKAVASSKSFTLESVPGTFVDCHAVGVLLPYKRQASVHLFDPESCTMFYLFTCHVPAVFSQCSV